MPEPVVSAPNAGAGSNAGAGAGGSQPIDYSKTTDDQLLDSAFAGDGAGEQTEDGESPDLEAAENSETEAGGEQSGNEGEETDTEELETEAAEGDENPLEQVVEPENLKAVFKMPGVGPEVRKLFYSNQAYREIYPTVREAREIKALVPTLDEAQAMVQSREALDRIDEGFYSNDPTKQQEFLSSLHQDDPKAFASLMKQIPELQSQLDPEAYKADTSQRVQDMLENMMETALRDGDKGQNLRNALDVIALRLFGRTVNQIGRGQRRPDPREQLLSRREQAIAAREKAQQAATFQTFHDTTNDSAVDQVLNLIKSEINGPKDHPEKGLLKNAAVTEQAKNKIIGEIYSEIDATLKANRELRATLRQHFRAGKFDNQQRDKIVQLVVGRAKLVLKNTAAKVVNRWTNEILASNKAKIQARTGNKRPDITGGSGGAGGGNRSAAGASVDVNKLNAKNIDWANTSDDDLLDLGLQRPTGKVALRK